MNVALVWTIVAAIALAGCSSAAMDTDRGRSQTSASSSGPDPTKDRTGTTAPAGTASPTSTPPTSTAPLPNRAPRVVLTASDLSGHAPWSVNVTLVVTDPDEDPVQWTLDFGDGTAPASGTGRVSETGHTYLLAGNHTITATATDRHGASDTGDLVAQVGAGTGQSEDLSWLVGDGDSTTPLDLVATPVEGTECMEGPEEGVSAASFTLDPATVGLPLRAEITGDQDGAGILSWSLYFHNPDCTAFVEILQADGKGVITGTVPEGTHPFVYAASMGGANLQVHYASGAAIAEA